MAKHGTLFQRLVANTRLAVEDNTNSCWLWTGHVHKNGYPRVTVRVAPRPAPPRGKFAHRLMLEEVLDAEFPNDEAGHLCYEPRCVNPSHLEVQTPAFNKSERRGYAPVEGCYIPVLYPRGDELTELAERCWDEPGTPSLDGLCPF